MALSAEWEAVLNAIPDATLREARRKELTAWHENGLRQEDYNKKLNEQAAIHKANLEWHQKNQGLYQSLVKDHESKERENADLKRKLAEAEAARAAYEIAKESTPANLEEENPALAKAIQEARARAEAAEQKALEQATRVAEINKMIEDGRLVNADRVAELINKGGDAYGTAMFKIWDLQQQHVSEFGKPLDRNVLLTEANKRGGDLDGAYKVLTEEARMEKIRQEATAKAAAEKDAEWNEKIKKTNLPYAAGVSEPQLGPLQMRLASGNGSGTGPSKIPDDIKAGDPRLSYLIAQELRQEGKVP